MSLCFGVSALSLDQEKNTLAKLKQQQQQLNTLNRELASAINQLDKRISLIENSSNEFSDALTLEQAAVNEAQGHYDTQPTLLNQSRLENAKFRYVIALRRYEKGNPELAKLIQEREELKRAKQTNELNMQSKRAEANTQIAIIERIEAEIRNKAAELATAAKNPSIAPKSPETLQSSEEEHQAALAEVKRLRAEFAAQKQAYIDQSNRNLAIEDKVDSADDKISARYTVINDAQQSQQLDEKYKDIAKQQASNDEAILDKFLTLKTFERNNLSSRKTIKLMHLGNHIFKAELAPNKADSTVLVVGSQAWQGQLYSEANVLITIFDLRDPSQATLAIYQQTQ